MAGSSLTVLLGPGFAPALAGLGVLDCLQARRVPVDCVVGVNTGALAAALWAVGANLALAARVIARLPWHRYAVAHDLGSADPLLTVCNVLTRRADFTDVSRPIAIAAADAETGELVWLQTGSVAQAVRATVAVPGLFEPLSHLGRRLVDGGSVWPLTRERFAGARILEVEFGPAVQETGDLSSEFGPVAQRLAAASARAWGASQSRQAERLVVSERVGGLLDFHLAEEWFAAGQRAFEAWLAPGGEDVGS